MRLRRVKHFFDNSVSQDRYVIIFAECNHTLSVPVKAVYDNPKVIRLLEDAKSGQAMCAQCEAPTVQETRAGKRPQTLWKEAGEP